MIKLELFKEQLREDCHGRHWHNSGEYSVRRDIYIPAKLNGVDAELHLMNSDGSVKENAGKWHCSFNANKNENTWEYCSKCSREVAPLLAMELFPKLKQMGYPIAFGHSMGFFIFNVHATSSKHLRDKNSRRQLHYIRVHEIVCPIHGKFIQESEESSL